MSEQEKLKRQINAYQFSMWELHLFLDSHPNNCDAAKMLDDNRTKLTALTEQYESTYGPINETPATASRWAWVSDPWPWDIGMEGDD